MTDVPAYSITDTTHTFAWDDGSTLKVQEPHWERSGRLLAEVVAYADQAHLLNHTTGGLRSSTCS